MLLIPVNWDVKQRSQSYVHLTIMSSSISFVSVSGTPRKKNLYLTFLCLR